MISIKSSPILLIFLLTLSSCTSVNDKPSVDSQKYRQAVSDFYLSLAALESNNLAFATKKMDQVTKAFSAEPASWANLGVYAMRQGDFELATKRIAKALDKADQSSQIQFLAGILESRKGNIQAATKHMQQAIRLDPNNPKILYTLAQELERESAQENAKKIEKLLNNIRKQYPNNLPILLEKVRTASKWSNKEVLNETLQKLEDLSSNWPDQIQSQFRNQQSAILQKDGNQISFELALLRNSLSQLPRFQHDLQKIELPPNQVGFLLTEFLWLPNAEHKAAPLDNQLYFTASDSLPKQSAQLFKPLGLADNQQAATIHISDNNATINMEQSLEFPGRSNERLASQVTTTLDYNYDFLNDIAFASSEGFKLYKQQQESTFTEVTQSLNLPPSILNKAYNGSWSYDLDLDGDLDLLLSASDGNSHVLRNNGDGTFAVRSYFKESQNIRDFFWSDFDRDGDSDAVILTEEGQLHYYTNERAGKFSRDNSLQIANETKAIDFGDLNSDGIFEIISWQKGRISSSSIVDSTGNWNTQPLLTFEELTDLSSDAQIFVADLDNNGALDILTSDQNMTKYWLSDENISLTAPPKKLPFYVYDLSDVNSDTRLDLVGLNQENKTAIMINSGSKNYNARIISPRASGTTGDQRINSFGIGGEIESRSGLQYLKQPIAKPWVHIGLGDYQEAEMLRIIWPNGSMQAEFAELGYDDQIQNEQILKGSCPWVLTYNGEEIEFVTDFLWRTSLGLKINAQGDASVIHSIDWIKIPGHQLKPRDGFYDVRITADLWETHFFDHISLMAVDHPKDTDVFVDERFTLPAPEQKLYPMKEVYPIASATDQDGNNVTNKVTARDGKYLNSFSLTHYQGLAKEHYVEVAFGDDVPNEGKLKLLANGWVYPTDTSVNIAISQGNQPAPHGIRVEVPDGNGGWKVAHQNIGFPAGKNKTVLVDLEGIFIDENNRKVRLYTNMEIYWDQIQVGLQDDNIQLKTRKLTADSSTLRYRGYSELVKKDRFSPTAPNYQSITGTTPKWRDLIGFYTRFGEVNELTKNIDDRYVIMNAGDELVLKFKALDPPKEGWARNFVLIGDGWVKDGDYNTGHSKTVLPLPYHGMEDYSKSPGLLQDDPVYQKHKKDWVKYHTRYVTPHSFNTALKFK